MSLYLTPAEVVELTDRVRPSAQARRLKALGVPFLWDKNGPVKVPRGPATCQPTVIDMDLALEPDFTVFAPRA